MTTALTRTAIVDGCLHSVEVFMHPGTGQVIITASAVSAVISSTSGRVTSASVLVAVEHVLVVYAGVSC